MERRGQGGQSRERVLSGVLGAAIAAAAAWAVAQGWGLRWDFANFYDTGHRILAGQARDIYDARSAIEGQPPLGVMIFWGTPLAGLLYVPLALLPPRTALLLFKLQNLLAYIAALWILLVYYLKRVDTDPAGNAPRKLAAFLFLCLIFQPFWTVFLVGGQTTPTVFLLLVLFLIAYTDGRTGWSAFLLSLVFVIKPAFVVMLAVFLIARQFKFLAAVSGWLLLEASFSILWFGWDLHAGFATHLLAGAGLERLWLFNSSLAAFIRNFSLLWRGQQLPATAAALLDLFVFALKLGVLVLFAALWRDAARDLKDQGKAGVRTHVAFLSMLFFLLVSEIVWEHYVMILFMPATYVLARRTCFSNGALALIWAALLLSFGQNIAIALMIDRLVDIDSFLEILAVGLYKSGPLLLMAAFLVRYHGQFVRSHMALSLPATSDAGLLATPQEVS